MKIGPLVFSWRGKEKKNTLSTIEDIKTLGVVEYKLTQLEKRERENIKLIGELQERMERIENTNFSLEKTQLKENIEDEITALLEKRPLSGSEIREQLERGAKPVYDTLKRLEKRNVLIREKKGKRVLWTIL